MGMHRLSCVCAAALLAFTSLGCGDDSGDDGGTDAGPTTSGTGGTGGTGGIDSGMTMTGSGGTGGTTPMGGTTAMPPVCDTSIPTTATCGGVSCSVAVGGACVVPCCTTDDTCGTLSAVEGMVGTCQEAVQPDPRCPDYTGMVTLEGCCTESNTCGFISSLSGMCITSSMFLADLADMAGGPCDDDAGTADNDGGS